MTKKELDQLKNDYNNEKNSIEVSFEKILDHISIFEKGIPPLNLIKSCTIGDGIQVIDEEEYDELLSEFQNAVDKGRITKFVPASGAASRMFKSLQAVLIKFSVVNRSALEDAAMNNDSHSIAVLEFVDNIKRFAFYSDLREKMAADGLDFEIFLEKQTYSEILKYTLESVGLNYVNQPKGSMKFHAYSDGANTAFEEHLVESINYAKAKNESAKIHFTISPEYRGLINSVINAALRKHRLSGNNIEVSYSYQKPSTDTIAVTLDNKPFKDDEGKLVFRPSGHGALLENLNDLKGDIVFIKNIDNLVTERLRGTTYLYKKVLAGYLIRLQNKIFDYLLALENQEISLSGFVSIKNFAESDLSIQFDEDFERLEQEMQKAILKENLNRPIRVCGIVRNEGEPGGGPFWVKGNDGLVSLQLVEKTQIDIDNEEQNRILEASKYFSPVDLVCGVRDYKGHPFNLLEFTNPAAGLITIKTKDGRELKALELPGLWNGSMAKWITVLIKVPKITFNPVKEVNDLLRKEHQPWQLAQ